MSPEERLKLREDWYTRLPVIFNIIEDTKGKETCFMDRLDSHKCIRWLNIFNTDSYNFLMRKYNLVWRDYNVYVSLANYDNIPIFEGDLTKRTNDKDYREWSDNEYKKHIIGYDLLFDFDAENIKKFDIMCSHLYKLLFLFDINKICHSWYPSGNNFQVLVEYMDYELEFKDILQFTKNIQERFALKTLCLNNIGEEKKLRKCRYSLVNDKVCFPSNYGMKYNDIFQFDYYDVVPYNIMRNYDLYKRGKIKLNDFGEEENKLNFKKFIQRYDLI